MAGHPVKAHRAGTAMVDAMYKHTVEPADIVVVSQGGWPKDIDLFQSHKSLEHVKAAVKPGGAIILVARCSEGLGNAVFEEWINAVGGRKFTLYYFHNALGNILIIMCSL